MVYMGGRGMKEFLLRLTTESFRQLMTIAEVRREAATPNITFTLRSLIKEDYDLKVKQGIIIEEE